MKNCGVYRVIIFCVTMVLLTVAPSALFGQTSSLISPAPGSTLTSTTVTFTGGHKGSELEHQLLVGTSLGLNDIYASGSVGTANVFNVTVLPGSGTIYVRYLSRIPSGWNFTDQTYVMNAAGGFTFPAPIASPAPGSVLTRSSVTFTGGHTAEDLEHRIYVGTSVGASDIFNTGPMASSHTYTVSAVLPKQGNIYVRYWSRNSVDWSFQDHIFTMNVTGGLSFPPPLISPVPGSTLTSQTVTFAGGDANGDLGHSLTIGTAPGGTDLFDSGLWDSGHHGSTVMQLPLNGTIYVRYSSLNGSGWAHQDHTYTMDVAGYGAPPRTRFPAPVILPGPGATLTSTELSFVGGHTNEDLEHRLIVATSPAFGAATIFDSGSLGTGHQALVTGLPESGAVYVRYFSRNSAGWASKDHTYFMNAPGGGGFPAPIVYPAPGSTLTDTNVTFLVGHAEPELGHWIYVGTSYGGRDLYDSGPLGDGGHVFPATGLPTKGIIYVRAWSGTARHDYTYVMDVRPGTRP